MEDTGRAGGNPAEDGQRYHLRVKGHLSPRWAAIFPGMALTTEEGGTTLIAGFVTDQSQLHALLRQVRDLGLELLAVERPPPG